LQAYCWYAVSRCPNWSARASPSIAADSRGANSAYAGYVEHHRTDRAARIVQAVATAADGLGTSPLAVALAWVRDRPGVVAPVVGARDTGQLTGSLTAEDITLPPAIRSALDDVSAIEVGYPERWPR